MTNRAVDPLTASIGVVVPNKNGSQFLRDALTSILDQDYKKVECVVMDSESSDGSLDILAEFSDRICWFSERDSCAAQAINRGWMRLGAPILAWLNSDDMWAPGAARRVVEVFEEHPEADVVSGECLLVDEDGLAVAYWPTGPFDVVRSLVTADHILDQPAVFIRRTALERVGWLREMWLHDHDLWLRLSLSSVFVHIDEVLALGREREGNLGWDADLVARYRVKLVRDFLAQEDLPPYLRKLRRRSMSSAHFRAAEAYLRGLKRPGAGLRHLGVAVAWAPANFYIYAASQRRLRRKLARGAKRIVGRSDD